MKNSRSGPADSALLLESSRDEEYYRIIDRINMGVNTMFEWLIKNRRDPFDVVMERIGARRAPPEADYPIPNQQWEYYPKKLTERNEMG